MPAEFKWNAAFDSIAVHIDDLELYHNQADKSSKSIVRWEMEYFRPEEVSSRSDASISALAVLEKIINRGRITVLSGELERALSSNGEIYKAHQIQSAMVELVKHQKLRPNMSIFFLDRDAPENEALLVGEKATEDLKRLCEMVCQMYMCEDFMHGVGLADSIDEADIVICWGKMPLMDEREKVLIKGATANIGEIQTTFPRVQNPVAVSVQPDILTFLLNYIFRFPEFRENQIDAVERGLMRQDSIVLLPTGGGKTIVYQLLSMISPGISFVVSPIIALIDDQIANLYSRGIDRVVGLSSQMEKDARSRAVAEISNGQHLMCYVAPERFQNKHFLDAVEYYARTNIVSVVAIDEAHCVSEWGHDFRTAYLGLAQTCRRICATGNAVPPIVALTGTASISVLRDMQNDLGIKDEHALIQPDSFDRSEIQYRISSVNSNMKQRELEDIIRNRIPEEFKKPFGAFYNVDGENTNCGIIFCQNVGGEYGIMASEKQLQSNHPGVWDTMDAILPGKCGMYAGKMPDRWTGQNWNDGKREYAARFKSNQLPVMVTTKAYGMGIDKPNVRWVVHYGIPSSLEAYYQEVGRAARDGRTALAYLILSDDFPRFNRELLNAAETRIENITIKDADKGKWKRDDVSRALYFHTQTFEGVGKEVAQIARVLEECSEANWVAGQWMIPFDQYAKSEKERAVYRLQLLGVFNGYTVDYDKGRFVINGKPFERDELIENYISYIKSYQSDDEYIHTAMDSLQKAVDGIEDDWDFILKLAEHLLREFTYKVIEEGRRRAILNILETASEAAGQSSDESRDKVFRERLLAYLSTDKKMATGKVVEINHIINNATDIDSILSIIDASARSNELNTLLGQISRLMEAYPQHFGLHFIQAAVCLLQNDSSKFAGAFDSAIDFGISNYGISKERCADMLESFLNSSSAKVISAETFNSVIPHVGEILGVSPDAFLAKLKSKQAIACRKVNVIYSIAHITRRIDV